MSAAHEFKPLSLCVLTVSDSRTAADDSSGDYLVSALTQAGHQLADRALCADNLFRIRAQVSQWIVDEAVQVVLINGGTGFNEQNRVPEAVGVLFERTVQGFGEMFRQLSFAEIKGSAMQSRALAGLANRTLICCLPGSTGACQLGWEQLIRDQLDARPDRRGRRRCGRQRSSGARIPAACDSATRWHQTAEHQPAQ